MIRNLLITFSFLFVGSIAQQSTCYAQKSKSKSQKPQVWQMIKPQIQGMEKLKEDFNLFQFGDDEVYMIPKGGCIIDYTFDKVTNQLNKKETCESLIYKVTENGLVNLPGLSLDEIPVSLTKWKDKLLLAAQKKEPGAGKNMLNHVIIYELNVKSNEWDVFAPYGFTKEFYPQKTGNGLVHCEIGGIDGGPLYLIYGDPHLKVIKYEDGKWSFAHSEKASQGGISGDRGQMIGNMFYYSFQDYGHDSTGPHIKMVDTVGNLTDLGEFPITKAANSNIAFSGDGKNFILLTANARKANEKFGKYEIRTLINGQWEPLSNQGLPDNLTHYWTYTYNQEFYISARIAPSTGSVYNAAASVYKFNGESWFPVGNTNFTTKMPNFPKVFALNGNLYCIYSNQSKGGYTLMKLN